jgi:hypothetical protein
MGCRPLTSRPAPAILRREYRCNPGLSVTLRDSSTRSVKPVWRTVLLLVSPLLGPLLLHGGHVKDYRAFLGLATSRQSHKTLLVLRTFSSGGERRCLVLDPGTLVTSIRPASDFGIEAASREAVAKRFEHTAYFEALRDGLANAAATQNAGLTHLLSSPPGVVLTIDLCPSRKPLDHGLFAELIREFGKEERPVPVAVAVTGVWMAEHGPDLEFLKGLEKSGDISATWINHSYHHRWDRSLALKENFLLEKGTDVASEILLTEAAMIERGLTPSVFFRFPGLVSDRELVSLVESYGLIPVGSDAWLGKNQRPKEGSIVLVHGNGNEPIGIARFIKLIREERDNIVHRHWLMLDLREATVANEKKKKAS